MTVSFHKYKHDFFPGTGKLEDNGGGSGKYFAINVPLQDGIDDESYLTLFKAVMEPTVTSYKPSVIVLQCGADSLGCDRLGAFNLSIPGHGECVRFIKKYGIPLLVLGGGGYTIRNVSRCWTHETGVLLDAQLDKSLPSTPFDAFYSPDYTLYPKLDSKVLNRNTRADLERIRISIREKLRYLNGAPSIQMQEIPPSLADWLLANDDDEKDQESERNKDEREEDMHRARNEFFNGERERTAAPSLLLNGTAAVESALSTSGLTTGKGKQPARGRGAGVVSAAAIAARGRTRLVVPKPQRKTEEEDDGDSASDSDSDGDNGSPAPGRGRGGRGRARGRGRGRGRGAAVVSAANTSPLTPESAAATPAPDRGSTPPRASSEPEVEAELQKEMTVDSHTEMSVDKETPATPALAATHEDRDGDTVMG